MIHDPWRTIRNDNTALGATLFAARLKADLTQPELIAAIDPQGFFGRLNVPMLSRLERGEIIPDADIGQMIWAWLTKQPGELDNVEPVARATDPQTSHDAARSVDPLSITATHRWWLKHLSVIWTRDVLQLNFDGDPIGYYATDEGARKYYDGPRISSSGFRTRRAELRHAGLVQDSGLKFTIETGRQAIAWQLTPEGVAALKETPPS